MARKPGGPDSARDTVDADNGWRSGGSLPLARVGVGHERRADHADRRLVGKIDWFVGRGWALHDGGTSDDSGGKQRYCRQQDQVEPFTRNPHTRKTRQAGIRFRLKAVVEGLWSPSFQLFRSALSCFIGRGPKRFIDQTLNLAQPIERFLAEFVRSGRLTLGEYGTS
jgi:hypothetical protein